MNVRHLRRWACALAAVALAGAAIAAGFHRSFRNGYPASAGTAREKSAAVNARTLTSVTNKVCTFGAFKDRAWVTGWGKVTRILEDDLEPPCHQRILLTDPTGATLLVVNNIDSGRRLEGVGVGDTLAFKGEFIDNEKGGLVHWTHPDSSRRRPGGWLCKVAAAKFGEDEAALPEVRVEVPTTPKEYFAGRGPIAERVPAPVNDDWPDTGYWLSTNSGARHNRKCENYRKTRGYPCKKTDGRPCGKCGG